MERSGGFPFGGSLLFSPVRMLEQGYLQPKDIVLKFCPHAAKFQNFVAEKIVSRSGFDNLEGQLSHQSKWKKSVYETYEDASVSYDWTAKLKEKCDEVDIEYFTSPYDFESVDHVNPYVPAYKIGSGDVTWHEIIEHIALEVSAGIPTNQGSQYLPMCFLPIIFQG